MRARPATCQSRRESDRLHRQDRKHARHQIQNQPAQKREHQRPRQRNRRRRRRALRGAVSATSARRPAAVPHRQNAAQTGRRREAFRQPQSEREAAVADREQLRGIVDDLARRVRDEPGVDDGGRAAVPGRARTACRRRRSSRPRARRAERPGRAFRTTAPAPMSRPDPDGQVDAGTSPPPARRCPCRPASARSVRRRRRLTPGASVTADRQDDLAGITVCRDRPFGDPRRARATRSARRSRRETVSAIQFARHARLARIAPIGVPPLSQSQPQRDPDPPAGRDAVGVGDQCRGAALAGDRRAFERQCRLQPRSRRPSASIARKRIITACTMAGGRTSPVELVAAATP